MLQWRQQCCMLQIAESAEVCERGNALWVINLNNLEKFIPFLEVGWLRSGQTP
jgi:hypothetical protein